MSGKSTAKVVEEEWVEYLKRRPQIRRARADAVCPVWNKRGASLPRSPRYSDSHAVVREELLHDGGLKPFTL